MDTKRLELAINTLHSGFAAVADDGSPSLARQLEENLVIVEQEHGEQLHQKDETIKTLTGALEAMTHMAIGLHLLYRGTAKTESDGSHEKAFADALALVKKVRTP